MKIRKNYQVNEIFTTVQGEGVLVGVPSTFIRLQGCTVGCPWCDTKYTWAKGGERLTVEEILSQVTTTHVVITGGEPTMYNLDGLLIPLHADDRFVQLETSGQHDIKGMVNPDWVTWSPKQNLEFQAAFTVRENANEVKWVLDEGLDWETVWSTFLWYTERTHNSPAFEIPYFVLMPEGCPPKPENVERALNWLKQVPPWAQIFWRYGDRIQYRIGVQ